MASAENSGGADLASRVTGESSASAADLFRMVEGECQGHGAAQRVADHQRLLKRQGVDETGNDIGLFAETAVRAADPHGIARARPIQGNDVKIARQAIEQRMSKMMQLAAETVKEEDRTPLPCLDIVNTISRQFDKAARRRYPPFSLGREAPGREREIADQQAGRQKQCARQPESQVDGGHSCHLVRM